MDVRLTRHAKNRMRWHRIAEAEVLACVDRPSFQEPDREGKIHSWAPIGPKFLRVTWVRKQQGIPVITAVLKKKPPKGLRT